jgi:hypothetical protein
MQVVAPWLLAGKEKWNVTWNSIGKRQGDGDGDGDGDRERMLKTNEKKRKDRAPTSS